MIEDIKIGVVGTGLIFGYYSESVKWINENTAVKIKFVAAVNRSEEGNARASSHGIPNTYTNIQQMMENEVLDAVLVLVPPRDMHQVTISLIPYGLPVLIEKPPGISIEEAKSISSDSLRYRTSVMVAFNRRFYSLVKQADHIIQSSGGLLGMRMDGFERYRIYRENGMDNSKLDHLMAYNTVHCIDLIRHYAGNAVQIYAFNNSGTEEPNNHRYTAMIVTDRNIPVTFQSYWHALGNWNYELYIPDGKITFANLEEAYFYKRNGDVQQLVSDRHDVEAKAGFVEQLLFFINTIKHKTYLEGTMSIHDAVKTMELVKAIEG